MRQYEMMPLVGRLIYCRDDTAIDMAKLHSWTFLASVVMDVSLRPFTSTQCELLLLPDKLQLSLDLKS